MTTSNATAIRSAFVARLMSALEGEDLGFITSNCFNLPVVAEDGEEGWVEITVKVPKEDDGYDKREEYRLKCETKAEKAAEAAKKKAAKVAADKAKREAKAAEKAVKEKEG